MKNQKRLSGKAGRTFAAAPLLACPFCGGEAKISAMQYVNTGRIYGYRLKCVGCGLEIKEQPAGWVCGKENETMLEAKAALESRWNMRSQANSAICQPDAVKPLNDK